MDTFKRWTKNFLFLLVAIFSGGTFFVIAEGVTSGSDLAPFNTAIEEVISHVRTPLLTHVMLFVTNIGSPFVLTVLAVFIAVLLLLNRDTYDALLYLVALIISITAFIIFKNYFQIARPEHGLVVLTSWGFPSGHATVATAFFFATAYTYFDHVKMIIPKILLILGCVSGAALVSLSRIYLGAHFTLDVLAGMALGLLAVSVTVLLFDLFLEEESWRHRLRFGRM